jgi:hypothetical protein
LAAQSHPDENLTGPQPATTEEVAAVAEATPAPRAVAAPETVRVAPAVVASADTARAPTPVAVPATAEETPAATTAAPAAMEPASASSADNSVDAAPAASAPVPAAPEAGDDEATQKIRTVLADYYADLFAPPLNAENYFAPQVERLYIQQSLTPAQINATITQTFFPDNKQAVYQVVPGTLRVSAPAGDGSRTATYEEAVRLYRVSKGRYQRLRTQVRAKVDADYRITFLRQEKMLENAFE